METRAMHAYEEYGLQYVSPYENVSAFGRIAATAGYPGDDRRTLSHVAFADTKIR